MIKKLTSNSRSNSSSVEQTSPLPGITIRSIVIAILLTIIHTGWLSYEEVYLHHISATNFSPVPTVIALLFILMALNSLLKKTAPSYVIRPAEMIVIFVMTTLGAVMIGNGGR